MNRLMGSFLAVAVLSTGLITTSQAAVPLKAGSTCSKVGLITTVKPSLQKFICTKSGKKLAWQKYMPPAPAPLLPQTPTTSTPTVPNTPVIPSYDSVRTATFNSVHAMACSSSHPHINVTMTTGQNTPADIKKAADVEIERTLNCFDSFFDSPIDLRIAYVTEKDTDLVNNYLPTIMGPQELANLKGVLARHEARLWGPTGGSGGGVAGRNSFGTNYYLILHLGSYSSMQTYMLKNVMHEFAHVLQGYGRKGIQTQTQDAWYQNMPGYFVEGGAETIAYAFSEVSLSGYNFQLNRAFKDMSGADVSSRNLSDVSEARILLEKIKNPATQSARDIQYPFGALICDYIIGTYGVDKFLALMKGASTYAKWSDNINAILGVNQADLETAALTWGLPLWKSATK